MILPHGGRLVNLVAKEGRRDQVRGSFDHLPRLFLSPERAQDARNIANGAYSPLIGFLRQKDFNSAVQNMRLADGTAWTIPIVLDINDQERELIGDAQEVLLCGDDKLIVILTGPEIFKNDKEFFCINVFGTTDSAHPGVAEVMRMNDYLLGGEIEVIESGDKIFPENNLSPQETRELFNNNGWDTVVAFQTRNAPHRSHEYLQKIALEQADALFIQPVIGKKKKGDFKDDAIINAYKLILEKHYPKGRIHLGILPLSMRYAGPREAVFHAIIRKNYGCTHFIVGRDHAGVGDYYGPYDAHKIFENFTPEEIGINILKYDNAFHCRECGGLVTADKCAHPGESRILLSGTQIRQMIGSGQKIPEEFMREEVVDYLMTHPNPFVE